MSVLTAVAQPKHQGHRPLCGAYKESLRVSTQQLGSRLSRLRMWNLPNLGVNLHIYMLVSFALQPLRRNRQIATGPALTNCRSAGLSRGRVWGFGFQGSGFRAWACSLRDKLNCFAVVINSRRHSEDEDSILSDNMLGSFKRVRFVNVHIKRIQNGVPVAEQLALRPRP